MIVRAIYNDQADELRHILKDEIDVNHPLVSICIISITAHYNATL